MKAETSIEREPWAVVYRCRNSSSRGIPIAAFFSAKLAEAWIAEAPHRKHDKIVMHEIEYVTRLPKRPAPTPEARHE